MKRFFIAILLFVYVGVLQAQDPAINKIKAQADSIRIVRGQEFDVPVRINSGASVVFSASFTLTYDTFPLDPIQVTPGSFLDPNALFWYRIDDAQSKVFVSISCRLGVSGSSGIGTLANVRFRTTGSRLGVRTITLGVTDIDVRDPNAGRLNITSTNSSFTVADIFVWPGDLNADGIASEADVLEIGTFFNKTGAARPNASFTWFGQPASLWSSSDSNVVTADATGEGKVTGADLAPIGFNYGRTHGVGLQPTVLPKLLSQGRLYGTVARTRDTMIVTITVDAVNFFGVALKLAYAPEQASFIGVAAASAMPGAIFFSRVEAGVLAVAVTKTRGQLPVSRATGVIVAKFLLLAEVMQLQFQDIVGRDVAGKSLGFEAVDFTYPGAQETPNMPYVYTLGQNYPNPFNPSAVIDFTVEQTGPAKLEVYNLIGQRVATLYNGVAEAGVMHTISVDGSKLTSGVYIYRLQAGGFAQAKKMVLVK